MRENYSGNRYVEFGGIVKREEFDTYYPNSDGYWTNKIISDICFEKSLKRICERKVKMQ